MANRYQYTALFVLRVFKAREVPRKRSGSSPGALRVMREYFFHGIPMPYESYRIGQYALRSNKSREILLASTGPCETTYCCFQIPIERCVQYPSVLQIRASEFSSVGDQYPKLPDLLGLNLGLPPPRHGASRRRSPATSPLDYLVVNASFWDGAWNEQSATEGRRWLVHRILKGRTSAWAMTLREQRHLGREPAATNRSTLLKSS
jgi:hypothetical protein